MPVFDREERWRVWVARPEEMVRVVEKLERHLAESAPKAPDAPPVSAETEMDILLPGRRVSKASVGYLTELRESTLKELSRMEIRIRLRSSAEDGLWDFDRSLPTIDLVFERSTLGPALTLAVAGRQESVVEGLAESARRSLDQIRLPRGRLRRVSLQAIAATLFVSTVLISLQFVGAEEKQWPEILPLLAAFGFVALLIAGFIVDLFVARIIPELPKLELVPRGADDLYTQLKKRLNATLAVVAALWTILGIGGVVSLLHLVQR